MKKLESLQNQISFFVDCYEQENKNTRIEGIGHQNVEHFQIDKIDDDLPFLSSGIQLSPKQANNLIRVLNVYRKEKELKFYFLGVNEDEKVVPLFVYDARVAYEDKVFKIHINFDSLFINMLAVERCTQLEIEQQKLLEEELHELGRWNEISKLFLIETFTLFDKYEVPYLTPQSKPSKNKCIDSIQCFGIVKKSKNTRGVKEDLKHILEFKKHKSLLRYSDPNIALFTSQNKSNHRIDLDYKLLPYTLSFGQYRIFESIRKHSLSVLIGPPGTGKTFTLVSLAIEAIRTGKSILICAKTDQALDVIEKKLKQEFDNHDLILRVGLGSQVKKLKQVIQDFKSKKSIRPISWSEIKNQRKRARNQFRIIHKLENEIEKELKLEDDFGRIVYKPQKSIQEKVDLFFLKFRISSDNRIAQKVRRLRNLYRARYEVNRKLVNLEHDYRVFKDYDALKDNLTFYQKVLTARNSKTRAAHEEKVDFLKLMNILPIWIVNISDLNRSIPMKQELFDFVFMDEASQCEVTLGIPALQRAKKAVIAGDPKQLNHISFLPKKYINFARERYGLEDKPYYDYRRYSLLDMVDAVTLQSDNEGVLEEHYRSQPSLIGFNNDYFYGNRLKVMTAHGSHRTANCNHFIRIDGRQKKDNTNTEELTFVVDRIREIYQQEREQKETTTIGIISPFRNQADEFKQFALRSLEEDLIARHDLLIGTPFEFQGEERDVIFISLTVDNDSDSGSFAYLSRENVLNVATSRAKAKQYVLHSFDRKRLSKEGLMYRFFNYEHHRKTEKNEIKDVFAKEVKNALEESGAPSVTLDEIISGVSIDLLIHGSKNDLCIDLIGYEGAYDSVLNLEEIESLFRSDKHVYVLPYRRWERNKSEEIKRMVKSYREINT